MESRRHPAFLSMLHLVARRLVHRHPQKRRAMHTELISRSVQLYARLLQRPHLLEMPDDGHIRIHIPIHTILRAGLFVAVKLAG